MEELKVATFVFMLYCILQGKGIGVESRTVELSEFKSKVRTKCMSVKLHVRKFAAA